MTQAKPLKAVVGARLREWREAAGLRQDTVAAAARRDLGLPWTRATVAAIEIGRRDLSLAEFLALPFLAASFPFIPDLRWRRLDAFVTMPAEGVARQPPVIALTPEATIRDEYLEAVLRGAEVVDARVTVKNAAAQVPAIAWHTGSAFRKDRRQADDERLDAEGKAARRLGVSTSVIADTARRLWGRTLTEERDIRVNVERGDDILADAYQGPLPNGETRLERRALQARRGHITRALIAELQAALGPRPRKTTRRKGR